MATVAKALLPPDPLPVGTPQDQFYTVINLNNFRVDVALLPALSFEVSQPVSPADGELYVLDGDWGLTFENEEGNPVDGDGLLAYYTGGTWYYFIPAQGILKRIGADFYTYDPDSSAAWQLYAPGGGAVDSVNGATGAVVVPVPVQIAVSDETTDLTTGTAKVTFRMPFAMTLLSGSNGVRASVGTAPTGADLQIDINEGGVSILSTPITIDAGEKTSTTAATPPVISDTALADDAEITIDIDQVGSTVPGAGLKVTLIGYKTP